MERELPKGWIEVKVGKLCKQFRGITYGKNDAHTNKFNDCFLVLRGGNIQNGRIILNENDNVFVHKSLIKEEQQIRSGDVLIVSSTGSKQLIGKAAYAKAYLSSISFGAFLTLLRPHELLTSAFFGYLFQTDYYRNSIRELSGGVNINNIRREYIDELVFPLPPLAEQQRIVAKLDTAFLHLDTLKKSVQRIPELLKRFRQLVLTQAVTGKLTEAWREGKKVESADNYIKGVIEKRELQYINANKISNKYRQPNYLNYSYQDDVCSLKELPNTWIAARVGLLCDCIVPGRDKPKSFTGKIPWITLPDITSSEITCKHGSYFLSFEEIEEVGAKIIPTESVIMSCIGRFGIAAFVKDPIVINQQLHAFLKSELIIPNYLIYCIQTSESYFNSIATATTISYLNKTNCNSLIVPLPPLEEQQQIVSTVEALFATADAIEGQYRSLKQKINKLPQALLAKAFRGELTEQHAHDEPAAALLQRIRNAKALAKTGSKPYQLFSDDNTGSRVAEE